MDKAAAEKAIAIAISHLGKGNAKSMAELRLWDARECLAHGLYRESVISARDSLVASVGPFTTDYDTIAAMVECRR